MVDNKTNFFDYVDNFSKIAHIKSIFIKGDSFNSVPEVTILIPTYNRPILLKQAIDSALHQVGYDDYEILVLDNNPARDDETERLLATYNSPQLNYYKNEENVGMYGNWNRGIELAKGKWIAILHDDDLLNSNFLSESMEIVNSLNGNVGCLSCKKKIFKQGDELDLINRGLHEERVQRIYPFDNYTGFVLGAPTGALLKKSCVVSLGGFNPDYFPTCDFCFLVYLNLHYPCYLNSSELLWYRIQDNESLKLHIMQQSIIQDYYLLSQLMRLYFIPLSVFKVYFYYCCLAREKELVRFWNSTFSLDFMFDVIVIEKYSRFSITISRLFFKIIKIVIRKKKIIVNNSNVLWQRYQ